MTSKTHMKKLTTSALRFLAAAVFLTLAWSRPRGRSRTDPRPHHRASSSSPARIKAPVRHLRPPCPRAGPDIENPPLSGLDQPTSEPAFLAAAAIWFPELQLSESVNSTTSGVNSKTSGVDESFRGLGSLDLQKIWRRSQLGLGLRCRRHGLPGPHSPGPPEQRLPDAQSGVGSADSLAHWAVGLPGFVSATCPRDHLVSVPTAASGGFSSALAAEAQVAVPERTRYRRHGWNSGRRSLGGGVRSVQSGFSRGSIIFPSST